jgi:hypothetical protein
MSLGVNTITGLLKDATKVFGGAGFDIEIVERHHNQKLDAPSGTAIMLADAINAAADGQYEYIYDRSQRMQKRDKKELGISAVRGGNIPGTHEIIFAGPDEVIELRHVAYSRSIFGNGALSAAKYLAGRKPGMYDMNDVMLHFADSATYDSWKKAFDKAVVYKVNAKEGWMTAQQILPYVFGKTYNNEETTQVLTDERYGGVSMFVPQKSSGSWYFPYTNINGNSMNGYNADIKKTAWYHAVKLSDLGW